MDFYEKLLPYARKAGALLDIPASVILGQWSYESARGTSSLAERTGNFAGIKHVSSSIDYGSSGMYADYKHNLDTFTADYVRVMELSYYNKVRDAVSVQDTIEALSLSPYAESRYKDSGSYSNVWDRIKADNLLRYDAQDILVPGAKIVRNIPVEIPENADKYIIAGAIIVAGVVMLMGDEKK